MVNDLTGQLNFMSQIVHGNKMTAIFHTNFEGINAGFSAKLNFSIFILHLSLFVHEMYFIHIAFHSLHIKLGICS